VERPSEEPGLAEVVAQAVELLVGLVTVMVRAGWAIVVPPQAPETGAEASPELVDAPEEREPLVALVPGLAVALVWEAERRAVGITTSMVSAVEPIARRVSEFGPVRSRIDGALGTLRTWSTRGAERQARAVEAVDAAIRRAAPDLVDAVLERVDLNEILDRIDLNAVLDRIDLEAMLDRVDFRQIVRESSSSVTSEAVDAVRVQGMNADRFVDRLVDRILLRKAGRDLAGPVIPDPSPDGAGPA